MKKPFLQVSPDGGSAEIVLEGVISSEEWWGDEFTPDMMRNELAKHKGKPLTVIINSPGGEVFAGAAIYNALRTHDGEITVRVDGIAASMASIIAMVGARILMSPGSTMMVHRPSVLAWGNVNDMNAAIKMLEEIEDSVVPIYEKRTGKSKDEIMELLDAETWMSADKAVELGFADAVDGGEPQNVFAKIKTMMAAQNFAFSMSANSAKGLSDYVAKAEAEAAEHQEADNDPEPEPPAEPAAPEESANPEDPSDDPEDEETVDSPKETETNPTDKNKELPEMKKPIATDNVVEKPAAVDPAQVEDAKRVTKAEARKMIVNALAAKFAKKEEEFSELHKEIKATMVIDGTSGEHLFVEEVLASDIREKYSNVGRVGQFVNRIDIEGAELFKQLVETAGNGFQPVALGGTKEMDQPVWTPVTFEPFEWALIVAWLDGVQKRSPIAVYNQIVRYIAKQYAKLEDKIILTYEGGTIDGETRPATGLVPILTSAGRVTPVESYDSVDVIPALGIAYGEIESDEELAIVANRKTWGRLATSLDENGRPVFTVVGQQVQAGALGTFNVAISQELEDGDAVLGAYDDYNLVTRGGLEYLFSREATVGEGESALNLFTNDASALRADVDITGKPVLNTSFQLLQFLGESS